MYSKELVAILHASLCFLLADRRRLDNRYQFIGSFKTRYRREKDMLIKEIGTYVRIKYTVFLESGEILKGDPEDSLEHMDFVTGFGQVLPGLERRLIGQKANDKLRIKIPPEEAFGSYDPSLVRKKSFSEFPEGESLDPGKWVLATNVQHKIKSGYLVREKGSNSVTLDYNHPFAGKALIYNIVVVEARAATQEELALIRPCDFEPGNKTRIVDTYLGAQEEEDRT